jgi:hypothetical protein
MLLNNLPDDPRLAEVWHFVMDVPEAVTEKPLRLVALLLPPLPYLHGQYVFHAGKPPARSCLHPDHGTRKTRVPCTFNQAS